MTDATLHCDCGHVRGVVASVAPNTVNRVVCYCEDCQAFLHALSREDLLDANGGTDIVQVALACLSFTHGQKHIAGLRLTEKGLYRWYAACCNTPLGNTVGPALPFVGIVTRALRNDTQNIDDLFGPAAGGVHGKSAIGHPPNVSPGFGLSYTVRAMRKFLRWWLRGQAWPHPFFDRETGAPRFEVTTLPAPDREALRSVCGPTPSAQE